MKAVQQGGPETSIHRCIVVYGFLFFLFSGTFSPLSAETEKNYGDFAEIYIDQYFPPGKELILSEASQRKSRALAHYALGRTLESQGKLQEAIAAYTEVLQNQPDQFFLARKTAYLLARSGQQEEALKLLEDSLRNNPNEPYAHISLSEYLSTYQANDPESRQKAFEVIEKAVAQFPDEPAVYEHLVKLYLSSDRREEARQIVATAALRENKDPTYWVRLGRLAIQTRVAREGEEISDADLVNSIYAKALENSGQNMEVIEHIGDFYHASSQFDRAIDAYARVIVAQPDRLDVRLKLARAYGGKGDQEKVLDTLKEIAQLDSQNADVHKQIAGILMRTERFKEAIPHLQSALSITKGSATEYGALGRMMIESDENEVAIQFLQDAEALFPDSPDFPFLLTFPLARLEKWEDAIVKFEAALKLAKDTQPELLNEGFYFRYAAAHERLKHFEKAEELFRKTIELIARNDPDDENRKFSATVYNYLGYMWIENDMKIDEAGELIKTAVELDPESGAIADSLGWFYFKKGNFKAAHEELMRAEQSIEELDPVILDHIGQTLYQLGETEKAIGYLERAVEMEPENEEYSNRLKALRDGTEKRITPASESPDSPPETAPKVAPQSVPADAPKAAPDAAPKPAAPEGI
jgi:tetratricopeptide (TPR) repeat protein